MSSNFNRLSAIKIVKKSMFCQSTFDSMMDYDKAVYLKNFLTEVFRNYKSISVMDLQDAEYNYYKKET